MKNKGIILTILIAIICIIIIALIINKNINLSSKNDNQSNLINSIREVNIIQTNEYLEDNKETELSVFSTPLSGDENRINNISLSCNTINGTKLKNGETFSFNDIIGQPTADKGYKEADVIIDTTLTKGLGGGNCQVSTTLYNACLTVDGIEVIERHPHKRKVTYVEEGKDASVSYGTLDLKFTNNTGKDIIIYMNTDNQNVTARIVES